MTTPVEGAELRAEIASLEERLATTERKLARAVRVRDTLMNRVERSLDSAGSEAYALFERNILLERHVAERTRAIAAANEELRAEIKQREIAEQALSHARDTALAAEREAVAASKAKSAFLANMSHELRTPMNGVIGMAELALQTPLSAEQRRYIETVHMSARSLLRLVNDILDLSKLEASVVSVNHERFNPRDLVVDVLRSIAVGAHKNGLRLTWTVNCDVPDEVLNDPGRLSQILLNLVGNAVKFTESGGVHIAVSCTGTDEPDSTSRLRFAVSDTGIGIPESMHAAVLESFVQADESTTRRFGGTGLGLAIVRRLVARLGGRLDLQSKVGVGTTITFEVPIGTPEGVGERDRAIPELAGVRVLILDPRVTESCGHALTAWGVELERRAEVPVEWVITSEASLSDPAVAPVVDRLTRGGDAKLLLVKDLGTTLGEPGRRARSLSWPFRLSRLRNVLLADDEAAPTPLPGQRGPAIQRGLRVLLAEDQRVNQEVAAKMLSLLGHQVRVAADGDAAWQALQASEFDLLITDIQMPLRDGLTLTRDIRSAERGGERRLPIIAVTAHAMVGDEERFREAGVDGYLPKPMDLEALRAALAPFVASDPSAPAVSTLPSTAAYDREAAIARMRGDGALVTRVEYALRQQTLALLTSLPEAIDRADLLEARRLVHAFVGAAGTAGAHRTAALLQPLQASLRAGVRPNEHDLAAAESGLHALMACLEGHDGLRPASLPNEPLAEAEGEPEDAADLFALVIDDDRVVGELMCADLASVGVEATWVSDAEGALEQLSQELRSCLLILDWQLPGMSGLDMLRQVRATETPDRRRYVLMVTARTSTEDHIKALQAGADDFLRKPWSPQMLFARVGAAKRLISTQRDLADIAGRLKQSEGDLRALIDNMPDAVFIHRSGTLLYSNRAARRDLGHLDGETLRDRSLMSFAHPDDHGMYLDQIEAHLSGPDSSEPFEVRRLCKSGEVRIHEVTMVMTQFDGDRSVLELCRDVTDRRRLASRAYQMDHLIALGTLAGGVGHAVNNPLIALHGSLERALEQAQARGISPDDPLTAALNDALEGADQIAATTGELRNLAQGSRRRRELCDVNEVLARAVAGVVRRYTSHTAPRLDVPLLPPVRGDAARLTQAFAALCANALQASEVDSEVRITGRQLDGQVVVEVADRGHGIEHHLTHRIFEPFFTTREAAGATGLGLSICRKTIEDHGGEVRVASTPGGGTTATVILPAAGQAKTRSDPAHRELEGTEGGRPRVLVVDDDPRVGRLIARLIGRTYDTEVAHDGAAALEILSKSAAFDAIVSDMVMPGMSGRQLHQHVRARWPELAEKMIFVTGGAPDDAARAFLAGRPKRSLFKPFSHEDIIAALAHVQAKV